MRRYLTLLLAIVTLAAGCTTDLKDTLPPEPTPISPVRVPMRIEVGEHPDSNPDTRIALDGDKTTWEVGDVIAVKLTRFVHTDSGTERVVEAATFTIESADDISNGGKRAHFSGSVPVGEFHSVTALYPASGLERAVTVVPLTQTDAINLFMSADAGYTEENPLVIEENPAVKPTAFMQFRHIMHKVDFNLSFLNDDNTEYDSSDFTPSTDSSPREVVIEMTIKGETGMVQFPLLCAYDLITGELKTEKIARANTLILKNHDFVAQPTVSMLMFPQEFVNIRMFIDIYIDGIKRHHIVKPASGVLASLKMSRGKTTSIGLKINDSNAETPAEGELFGDGSEENPYIIPNLTAFNRMKEMLEESTDGLAGKYFIQIASFDLGSEEWSPSDNAFCGNYDGNGYTITINNGISDGVQSGIFYGLGDGVQTDVVVENLNIECNGQAIHGGETVGLLAGTMTTGVLVSNCHVSGNFDNAKNGSHVAWGGLIGEASGGIIDLSSFRGEILSHVTSGQCYLGGLVAHITNNTLIINSFTSGTVGYDRADSGNTGSNFCGGFVGLNEAGHIVNCYASGNVFSRFKKRVSVGGFIGKNDGGHIANCYSIVDMRDPESGELNNNVINGTFIGTNASGNFYDCHDATDNTVPPVGNGSSTGVTTDLSIGADLAHALNAFVIENNPATTDIGVEIEYSPWSLNNEGAKLGLTLNPEVISH